MNSLGWNLKISYGKTENVNVLYDKNNRNCDKIRHFYPLQSQNRKVTRKSVLCRKKKRWFWCINFGFFNLNWVRVKDDPDFWQIYDSTVYFDWTYATFRSYLWFQNMSVSLTEKMIKRNTSHMRNDQSASLSFKYLVSSPIIIHSIQTIPKINISCALFFFRKTSIWNFVPRLQYILPSCDNKFTWNDMKSYNIIIRMSKCGAEQSKSISNS